MPFDIYGESLRRGYCEVHPHVNQSYPCDLCYAEHDRQSEKEREKKQYEAMEREMYAEQERQYWKAMELEQYRSLPLYDRDPDLLTDKRF